MSVDVIQARYDGVDQLAQRFDNDASLSDAMRQNIGKSVEPLASGGWRGEASGRFLTVIYTGIFRALQRLPDALAIAGSTTRQIKTIIQTAEHEAIQFVQ